MLRSRVLFFVISFFVVAIVSAAPSVSSAETVSSTSEEPLILHMSDGRFYHPPSGFTANSRQELLARLQRGTPSSSTTSTPKPLPSPPPSPTTPDTPPLIVQAARRAKTMLLAEQRSPETFKKKPSDWREVRLAIWHVGSNEVRVITIEKNGKVLRGVPSDMTIRVRGGSGYDTDYAILPAENIVVGVGYPIVETIKQKKFTTYRVHEIVYVPYGQDVHTEAVIRWGKITLDRLVESALQEIRAQGVVSKAFPGRLLADVADPVALKSIMAIEHLDHGSVGRGADDRLDLFYLELGLNEGDAFGQEVSRAGANGLLQFIPATYASLVKRWPSLSLVQDFHAGTGDLANAIKAEVAYLDDVWLDLPVQAKDGKTTSPENMRAYLIAAYNTGGVRVRRAINRFGEDWDKDHRPDWNRLDAEQTNLAMAIHRLKKKLKTEPSSTMKKKLTSELASTRMEHEKVTNALESLDRSRLKAETLGYLLKYRLIAPRMKRSEVAVN